MGSWWRVAAGRRRVFFALVVPAVLAVVATVVLGALTASSARALSDNVKVTQDLVDGNVRTLSQVQRELLRLQASLDPTATDADRIELSRALATQRIQEGTLDYQGRTLGDSDLLARSRGLAAVWSRELDPQVRAIVADPGTLTPQSASTLRAEVMALELRYNQLVSDAEILRKRDAAAANAATRDLVRDTRLLLGGLGFTLVALVVLVAGMIWFLNSARSAQLAQTARLHDARALLQRHSVAVQTTDNLVVITDELGRIEWVNDAFTRRTGYDLADVVGSAPGSLLQGPDTDPATVAFMRDRLAALHPFTCEVLNYSRTGEPYWVALEVRPILEETGHVTGFVAVQSDVTKRRLTEDALRAAKETAEETARAKEQFLANMSHEIRTPLNAVLGLTELLLDTDMGEEQRLYVTTAYQSGVHLLALVNDILDFSALESGRLELESTAADVRAVIAQVFAMLTPIADRAGLALTWEADGVPSSVLTDVVRLRQLLINLVGNGLKFTPHGSVSVRASFRPDPSRLAIGDQRAGDLVLEVADTGVGIPADRLDRIFGAFTQGDASTTRTHGGTGLGLAICRRIAQRLGGDIAVVSTPGTGSTFTVTVPVTASDAVAGTEVETRDGTAAEGGGQLGLAVLLAEDDRVNQMVATRMLRRLGIEVDVAADGVEALEAAAAKDYDVILMDVNMPNLDGLSATRQLRQRTGHQPRVVALTANAAEGDRDKVMAAGMDEYLSKPYTLHDLRQVLSQMQASPVG
ncbi:hypothetical protein GCM10009867_30670 [Pedococcus aerophilus]|uniref:histidine kinase n=1 Tax=Pedococcus aerophilus TaxID=436356 RepID=A0ABN3UUS7_9MICO